jgi:hypothetical protein
LDTAFEAVHRNNGGTAIYRDCRNVCLTITHFVGSQKNEMLLEIADDLPNIEADKLKVKLACGQRKLMPS